MQPQIINQLLDILEIEQTKYTTKNWYQTHLANKHRFFSSTEHLLALLQGNATKRNRPDNLNCVKKSLSFLVKFGIELLIIKNEEKSNLRILKSSSAFTVIKTISHNTSFNNNTFTDPFLAKLYTYLKEEKNKSIVTIYEHDGQFKFNRHRPKSDRILINLYCFISWKTYFKQYFVLFFNLFKNKIKSSDPIKDFIHSNYKEECISPQFFMHDMQYDAFHNLLKNYTVNKIYSTFENNGWEKMLVLARNDLKSPTKILAHQHVPIAPSALNYYLTKPEINLLPDQIITIGNILTDFLISIGYPTNFVRTGCALRLKLNQHLLPPLNERKALIALDGIPQAAVVLNTILENIETLKTFGWKFIIRFHPVLGLDKMKTFLTKPIQDFDLFEISKSTLDDDIKRSNLVFYWGSTVAFEAMYSGRLVVHTPGKEALSNDPITLVDGLHLIASDFTKTIIQIMDMSNDEIKMRHEKTIHYCEQYFGECNSENMKIFD